MASKTVTTGGPTPTITTVRDVYQAGRIAYQTDGNGTTLATFAYDGYGVPASVQVGSDRTTAPRSYYVYSGHGDVVALVDASGTAVATYSYDVFGGVTASESLPNGWTNPYRYDGKDRVRYDAETSLYWMSVRAYDPTLGRFISRDPLKRAPLFGPETQPYVYGGNNPLTNVDPSGQRFVNPEDPTGDGFLPTKRASGGTAAQTTNGKAGGNACGGCRTAEQSTSRSAASQPIEECDKICHAKDAANETISQLASLVFWSTAVFVAFAATLLFIPVVGQVMGPLIFGLIAAATIFGAIAGGALLKWQDYVGHNDPAWFNKENVDDFAMDLGAYILKAAAVTLLIAKLVAMLPGPEAEAIAVGFTVGGLSGASKVGFISYTGVLEQDQILNIGGDDAGSTNGRF